MDRIIVGTFVIMLFFGCIGQQQTGPKVKEGDISLPVVGDIVETANKSISGCEPEYTVTAPSSAALSSTVLVTVNAECAKGAEVEAFLDGASAGRATIPSDSAVLNFNIIASKDKANQLEVHANGSSIHSSGLQVSAIGFTDTGGTDNDPISIKHWKAVSFTLDNKIEVKSVGAYLRKLAVLDLGSDIVVEIRSDSYGEPGAVVATSRKPLLSVTMTPNWIYFPFNASLDKGRHWVVFRLTKDDSVNIHYVAVDKLAQGNPDHMRMDLYKNEDLQKWEETKWERLSFDRRYAVIVSAADN